MLAGSRRLLLLSGFVLLVASSAWAQTTTIEGDVKDENGQPLKGAVIKLDRTDIKGHYQVKSDKKGHWLYTGLPMGKYDLSCEVNGQVVDKVNNVQSKYGDSTTVNFDAGKMKQAQAAAAQAAATGQAAPDVERGMSKEQKEQYEAQLKQRSESMKKNKALNDAYNAGQDALKAADAEPDKTKKAADYQTAVDSLNKAGELDANQAAVWDSLGEAYAGLGDTQTGDDKNKSYDSAIAAYNKGLALKPDDAGVYNQIGNIYGKEKKIPEATQALTKAAQLDPAMAPKAYFNMGANLVNSGNNDQAAEFFKKAIDADPNYAEAHYQYGIALMAKATVDNKTGKITPPEGTAEQFQKYLELKPNGPYAQSSKDMLASLGETVQTEVKVPQSKKKNPK
ncbi:MAG: tetratricopeptide repeat protein [Bryobacteraceae bacterium]